MRPIATRLEREMPDLDYMVLADGVAQRPDGKIDIYGASWDTIFAPAVPTRHPQMAVAIRILMSQYEAEHEHGLRLILMSEDGPEIARADATVQAIPEEARAALPPGQPIGLGFVFNLAGLVFPTYGRYHFALLWDGNQMRDPVGLRVAEMPLGTLPGLPGGPPLPQ